MNWFLITKWEIPLSFHLYRRIVGSGSSRRLLQLYKIHEANQKITSVPNLKLLLYNIKHVQLILRFFYITLNKFFEIILFLFCLCLLVLFLFVWCNQVFVLLLYTLDNINVRRNKFNGNICLIWSFYAFFFTFLSFGFLKCIELKKGQFDVTARD